MWNGREITKWLENRQLYDGNDLYEECESIRDALIVAVEALGMQEEYREEALDKITGILGIVE